MVHSLAAADFPEIKAPALKAKMNAGEKVFLLNPLSDIEFNQGYISGSVNIPLHLLGTTDKLPGGRPREPGRLVIAGYPDFSWK